MRKTFHTIGLQAFTAESMEAAYMARWPKTRTYRWVSTRYNTQEVFHIWNLVLSFSTVWQNADRTLTSRSPPGASRRSIRLRCTLMWFMAMTRDGWFVHICHRWWAFQCDIKTMRRCSKTTDLSHVPYWTLRSSRKIDRSALFIAGAKLRTPWFFPFGCCFYLACFVILPVNGLGLSPEPHHVFFR